MLQIIENNFFLYIGIFVVVYKIVHFISRFIKRPYDLYARYGGGWAIVTGGTDGIGLGFCQELAKLGFNIGVVSRNKQKIDEVCVKLKQINNNIQTRAIVADFSNCLQPGFFQNIQSQIQDLDVSILVNNVVHLILFLHMCRLHIKYLEIDDNQYCPNSMITRFILPKMLKRSKKCGIVSLSSSSILMRLKYSSNYCSTKLFDDFFSRSLEYQYGDKIDFLSIRPGLVTTAMTKNTKSVLHCSKNQCALGSLKCLGKYSHYAGSIFHQLSELFLTLIPQYTRDFLVGVFWEKVGQIYKKIDIRNSKKV